VAAALPLQRRHQQLLRRQRQLPLLLRLRQQRLAPGPLLPRGHARRRVRGHSTQLSSTLDAAPASRRRTAVGLPALFPWVGYKPVGADLPVGNAAARDYR
jgi:hypothetical protein